jgi:hypothetical protein
VVLIRASLHVWINTPVVLGKMTRKIASIMKNVDQMTTLRVGMIERPSLLSTKISLAGLADVANYSRTGD